MELSDWQSYLRAKMDVLDESWKALDQIWNIVPDDVESEVLEVADKFHTEYWEVFHAAVQSTSLDELEQKVPAAIDAANKYVDQAWKIGEGKIIAQIHDLDEQIERASESVSTALTSARGSLEAAQELQETASQLIAERKFADAVAPFSSCSRKCRQAASQLDDATRADKQIKDQSRWSKARVVLALATLIIGVVLGNLMPKIPLGRPDDSPSAKVEESNPVEPGVEASEPN